MSKLMHHAIRNCYCLMMSSPYLNEFLNECLIYCGRDDETRGGIGVGGVLTREEKKTRHEIFTSAT